VALGHKLGIDATRKTAEEGYTRVWPPDITMDAPTRALVDRRWNEYGLRTRYESDAWSGQGEAALHRLLASLPLEPGSVDPASLRAAGVPALGPHT
jgi:hypothetical protein